MVKYGRKVRWLSCVLFLLGLVALPRVGVDTAHGIYTVLPTPNTVYKAGSVLVRFEDNIDRNVIDNVLLRVKAEPAGTIYGSDVAILEVAIGQELEISAYLSELTGVVYAEPDYQYAITSTPNDPFFGTQWAHEKLNSTQAWDITTGSTSINIAIIDTGIDATHPDLVGKILAGQSFLNQGQQDANPVDLNGHGTHVAGIVGAATNNNAGVAGMSWGANIIPVRTLGALGEGWTTDIAAGINWARAHGAHVINLSLGGETESLTMRTAIQAAHSAGVLVVGSMGNEGEEIPFYPAAYPYVLAVAATTVNNTLPSYSNYGNHTDISAPGGNMTGVHDSNGIYSTMPTYPVHLTTAEPYSTYYDYMQGTSQAAPFVSGLAAMIWSLEPNLSPDEVTNIITSTAVDLGSPGWDPYFGHGLADAKAALDVVNSLGNPPLLHNIENINQQGDYLLRWDPVEKATHYSLEVSADAGFSSPMPVYNGVGIEYQVTGQTTGYWYYRVMASNISDVSPWSNVVQTGVLPDPPVLMPISIGTDQLAYDLGWSAVEGVYGYVLQESAEVSFTQSSTRYVGSDLQHSITGQQDGTWLYRVQAFNSVGSSGWSNVRSHTVPTTTLEAPDLLPIDNSDDNAIYNIQWTTVPSTTLYTLEESESVYYHNPTEVYTGALTTYTVTDQAKGTWYYRVRGHTAGTSSPWSDDQKAIVVSYNYVPMILRQYTALLPQSYLANGDFEAGHAGWVEESSSEYSLIVDRTFPEMKTPHGGDWAVWMGGVYSDVASIQQAVYISAIDPHLVFWHWIESSESVCGDDNVQVIVNEEVIETIYLCLVNNTGGWVQHSVDLQSHAIGVATLSLRVTTDETDNSNYFIDDVVFDTNPVVNTQREKYDLAWLSLFLTKSRALEQIKLGE